MRVVELVNSRLSRNMKLLGMVITMFNSRTRSSKEVLDGVRKHYSKSLLKTVIPRNVTITDSTMAGSPVVKYRKSTPASKSYIAIAKENKRIFKMKWSLMSRKEAWKACYRRAPTLAQVR